MNAELNIHPADELAAIREEIKQMQAREATLRSALLEGSDDDRDGKQYRAVIIPSTRESIDKDAIIAALGREIIEPFIKATAVQTLKTVRKADAQL